MSDKQSNASFDFVAESMVTASNTFHGDKVSITEVIGALKDMSAAAERLDRIKKALFYGRDYIPNPTRPSPSRPDEDSTAFPIIERIAETLTLQNGDKPGFYGEEPHSDAEVVKLTELAFHAIVGVATEAGEMIDAWLNAYMHNKPLDLVNLREEFGDNQWYVAVFLRAFSELVGVRDGVSFNELHRNVNRKLRARFPAGFTEYDANNRDLAKERAILEEGHVTDMYIGRRSSGDDHEAAVYAAGETFDAEQIAAGSEMRGKPVEPPFGCKPIEFPDEPHSGVDPAPGKLSSEK